MSWGRGGTFFRSKDGNSSRLEIVKAGRGHRDDGVQLLVFPLGEIETQEWKWLAQIKKRVNGSSMQVYERKHDRKPDFEIGVPDWGVSLSV